jgi:hypothetical protein
MIHLALSIWAFLFVLSVVVAILSIPWVRQLILAVGVVALALIIFPIYPSGLLVFAAVIPVALAAWFVVIFVLTFSDAWNNPLLTFDEKVMAVCGLGAMVIGFLAMVADLLLTLMRVYIPPSVRPVYLALMFGTIPAGFLLLMVGGVKSFVRRWLSSAAPRQLTTMRIIKTFGDNSSKT